jgi:hypothetical protein
MYCFLKKFARRIYPSPDAPHVPPELQHIGEKRVADCGKPFDPETSVIRDFYSRCLYEEIPRLRDEDGIVVDDWFVQRLEFDENRTTRHAFFFIGEGRI